MQSDTDGVCQKLLPKKREWAEPDRARFHRLETAVAHEAIEFTRVMPLRLKP